MNWRKTLSPLVEQNERKLVIEGGGEAFAKSAMAALGFFCSPTRENENFVSPK